MKQIDRPFLISVIVLVVGGFLIFSSASLGLLARDGARFSSVAFSQLSGIGIGLILLLITSRIHYRLWRKYALYIFLATLLATLLVYIPGLGAEFNGARRWILLGSFSFQPSELLKIGYVIYFAAWLSGVRKKVELPQYGILPFLGFTAVVAAVILPQPDTDTFMVIFSAGLAMLIAAGGRWRDIFALGGLSVAGIAVLAYLRPYVLSRIMTFVNPAGDPTGAGYQIQQSLIAIGSGEWFGRGFGQSVQKFNYLPEPIGDSIFAVAAEEFGFIGASLIIILFLMIAFRGLRIASRAPDLFGGLLAIGIVILIVSQSFINIGAMLGVLPLTGIPLVFISHGGTAIMIGLASIGILLNISKHQKS